MISVDIHDMKSFEATHHKDGRPFGSVESSPIGMRVVMYYRDPNDAREHAKALIELAEAMETNREITHD